MRRELVRGDLMMDDYHVYVVLGRDAFPADDLRSGPCYRVLVVAEHEEYGTDIYPGVVSTWTVECEADVFICNVELPENLT